MRIDGDQRFRPKAPARIDRIDLISDILGADLGERASEARVVRNECAIQIKDIHDGYCPSKAWIPPGTLDRTFRRLQCVFGRTGCPMEATGSLLCSNA